MSPPCLVLILYSFGTVQAHPGRAEDLEAPDVFAYSAAIGAVGRAKQWLCAVALLQDLRRRGRESIWGGWGFCVVFLP